MELKTGFSNIFYFGIFSCVFFSTLIFAHDGDHSNEPRPGGSQCKENSICFSNLCYINGICAPDGPEEGTVAGGGACNSNSECFSNYCIEQVCAPDSPMRGKVSGGGLCLSNDQCYSGTCIRASNDVMQTGRCGPDSSVLGKMAAGGICGQNPQCFSNYCYYQRCAPDGPTQGVNSGGGFCMNDEQCTSKMCIEYRCQPESGTEPSKVADGGKCMSDDNCQFSSACLQSLCVPKSYRDQVPNLQQQQQAVQTSETKLPAGAYCKQMSECQTACIIGRCAPPSSSNPLAIADGGICDLQQSTQGQCKSGQCLDNICTPSHSDRIWNSATAGGGRCQVDSVCFSGFCSNSVCSSDSPAAFNTTGYMIPQRNRGQVPGGGLCAVDADCYSGFCDLGSFCGPDGPKRGSLASGAMCSTDRQCFSGYCLQRRCVASAAISFDYQSQIIGKVAPGGRCAYGEACGSGLLCQDTYCKANDPHGHEILRNVTLIRPAYGTVPWNGTCWHHAQCKVGFCLELRCTVPWYLVKHYSSATTNFFNFGLLFFLMTILFSMRL